jgi:hypothetical protein
MAEAAEMADVAESAAAAESSDEPETADVTEMAEAVESADAAETAEESVASNLEAQYFPSSTDGSFQCILQLSLPFTCSDVKLCLLKSLHNLTHPDNNIAI